MKNGLSVEECIEAVSVLTKILTKNGNLNDKYVEIILNRLENGLSVEECIGAVSALTKILTKNGKLNDKCVEIILNSLKNDLSVEECIEAVNALTKNGKLNDTHVGIILDKLQKSLSLSVENLIELTSEFAKNKIKLNNSHVISMLSRLQSGYIRATCTNGPGLISVLKALQSSGANLDFKDTALRDALYAALQKAKGEKDALDKYLIEAGKNDKDDIKNVENVEKENYININGKIPHITNKSKEIEKGMDLNEDKNVKNKIQNPLTLMKTVKKIDVMDNNINNVKNKIQTQNLNTLLESANQEFINKYINNGEICKLENENDQQEFKKVVGNQLSKRLQTLKDAYESDESWQNFEKKLEKEKDSWKGIGNELGQIGLLTNQEAQEFNAKIDDIYDVNGFVTALEWIGCVLSVPCTLGLILFWDKVRNRIAGPTTTRQYDRFQDGKDELLSKIAPLQEIDDQKIKNEDEI